MLYFTNKSFTKESNMLDQNERKILNLIKLAPILVLFFAVIITYVIIHKNNQNFQEEINLVKKESFDNTKMLLKLEIQRVYNFIQDEKKSSEDILKSEIKQRVYNAHTIATSIYKNNPNKSKNEIIKMIKDALRDIRFYKDRGYFFIYELDGTNILHPVLPHIENKNILNIQDSKGNYPLKEIINLVKEHKEGYSSWWWIKPDNKNNEYKKIGFSKLFEPYNLFIGTGEYVVDHEKILKENILKKINRIRYGVDGYIFAYDYDGNTLSHVKQNLLGTNRLDLQDSNGKYLLKEIIDVAKKGEDYLTYEGTIQPSTGKPANKISYIKGFDDWKWLIGTGTYMSELNTLVEKRKKVLELQNKQQITQIIIISLAVFFLIFIITIIFAKSIEKKFIEYKTEVEKRKDELNNLNNELEHKVEKRTSVLKKTNQKLKKTLKDLTETKKDLILSEKMAMLGELVGNITHEINSPLGLSITSITHIQSILKNIQILYKKDQMSENDFESFLKDLDELSKIISINLNNTSQLVKSFKNVAVDQAIEEKREFNLKIYIEEILLSLKSKTKKTKIEILLDCENDIVLNTYPNYIFQILTNFINNSILHGFENNENGKINIIVNNHKDYIELIYKDNGKGIDLNLRENIFKQYFTTKRGKGGTGLGLYIIKKVVDEKLHGTIKINLENKQGVEFIIEIPK